MNINKLYSKLKVRCFKTPNASYTEPLAHIKIINNLKIIIMKKQVLFIAIIMVIALNVNGQFFPGKKIDILLNKIVMPKQYSADNQQFHYQNFYLKFDTTTKELKTFGYKKPVRPFQTKNGLYSDYSKLVGKKFIVKKIYPKKPTFSSDEGKKFVLELFNKDIGTIYYDYDAEYEFNFELQIISKIDLPKDFYCDDITVKKDKFNGEISYTTPIRKGINFIKIEKDGKTSIYMSILQFGSTLSVGKKGLILLLENGARISRPNAEIDVDAADNGYRYSAFIQLTSSEINLLKKYRVTDDRLYIYDGTINKEAGSLIKAYINCIAK